MAVSLEMIYKYVKILFEGNGQSESIRAVEACAEPIYFSHRPNRRLFRHAGRGHQSAFGGAAFIRRLKGRFLRLLELERKSGGK